MSAAGDALARFPPSVARFRTCTEPQSPRPAQTALRPDRGRSAFLQVSAMVVVAPIMQAPFLCGGYRKAGAGDIDQHPDGLVAPNHHIRTPGDHARLTLALSNRRASRALIGLVESLDLIEHKITTWNISRLARISHQNSPCK